MNARQIAAEFAAYTWYEESRSSPSTRKEAARFAKENWSAFLPVAHVGWGKLLGRIASHRARRQWRKERSQLREPALA